MARRNISPWDVTSCLTKVINYQLSLSYLCVESKSLARPETLSNGTFGLNLKALKNTQSVTYLAVLFQQLIILLI